MVRYTHFGASHAKFFLMLAAIAGGNSALLFVLRRPLARILDQPVSQADVAGDA